MIEVNKDSKIYIICPAQATTGGPELLHQLAGKLKTLGVKSSMYYYGKFVGDPTPEIYKKYLNDVSDKIIDDANNIIVAPETNTFILKRYKKIRKVIWWLSVDNYFVSVNREKKGLRNILLNLSGVRRPFKFDNPNIIHFAQSKYAVEFLKEHRIDKVYGLSDYLNREFIESNKKESIVEKENIVAYNPKKGYEFTKTLIDARSDIKWCAIQNMKPQQVIDLLRRAKVYIDFGNHPGKDRIPREAAICGCCIVTGKKGAAKYWEDVPISNEFKFEDTNENIGAILEQIKLCFNNFESETKKFEDYREKIMTEEASFEKDVLKVFNIIK